MPAKVKCGNTTLEYSYDHKGRKTEIKVNGSVQVTYKYWEPYYDSEDSFYHLGEIITNLHTGSEKIVISEDNAGYGGGSGVAEAGTTIHVNNTTKYWNEHDQKGLLTHEYYYVERTPQLERVYSYDDFDKVTKIITKPRSGSREIIHQEDYTYNEHGELTERKLTGDVTQTYTYIYGSGAARKLIYVGFENFLSKQLTDANGRNTGREIYSGGNKNFGEHITYRKVGDHATNMPACMQFVNGKKFTVEIRYKYDSCGNISEITEDGHLVARYTYDSLNRLIREDNKSINKTVVMNYDNAGNITDKCKYAFTEYSIANATETGHDRYIYNGDKLVSYNGEVCEYNNLGNPTKYRNNVCEWQYGKLLTKYGGTTFEYDGLERRTKKGNITYTYDNDNRLIKQSNGLEFFYDESGIAAVKWNGATYFYMKDAQGNIVAIFDINGETVVKYNYDAWGTPKVNAGNALGDLNPFRYRGYYYDTETKLYYLQNRYYDPEVGRFISQDSIEYADPEIINGLNLYAYCANNPVMNVDPTGNAWWHWLAGAFAVVGLVLVGSAITVLTAGVGTLAGTMAGAVIYGASQGILIGATVGVVAGGVIGGAVSGWTAEGILTGMGIGFGAGAIIGAVIGGFTGASSFTTNSAFISQNGGNVKEILSAFKGNPKLKTLQANTNVFRTWGGTTPKLGHWVSPKNYGSVAKRLLSLPPTNTSINTSSFVLSKGTVVLNGRAAALFGQPGGGIQWWVALLS